VDSVQEPVYNYFITDTYQITLMVENTNGCRDTAYQWVDYRNVPFIHFPNAFSPNGDGVNDYFSIASLNLTGFTIRIFDRWGNLIYISDNPAFRWDGAMAGKGLPEGAYTFYFTGSGINGEKIEASGVVTLIR
jgi:gliding motility-associated-like protein